MHGAHSSTLTVAGETFAVRRTMGLIRRVEERFGVLRDLLARIEAGKITLGELADLYALILADAVDGKGRPATPEMVEGHALSVGVVGAMPELHGLLIAFFVGEDKFMERLSANPPMAAEAASPGASSSAPPQI